MKSPVTLAIVGLSRPAKGMGETGIRPADLHQQIESASERKQPPLHRRLSMFDAGRCPKTLRRYGADGRERVLDTMMQLAKNEFLQLVGSLALLSVNARFGEPGLGVDASLFQQQAKAVVFGR